jgi:hypothetical protein
MERLTTTQENFIPLSKQIDVLENAKQILNISIKRGDYYSDGLCYYIYRSLVNFDILLSSLDSDKEIKNYIYYFDIPNVTYLAKKYHFKKPLEDDLGYWWNLKDNNNRIKCINSIIKELKILHNSSIC